MEQQESLMKIKIKRSNEKGKIPAQTDIEYGELAMNYAKDSEGLFIKNSSDEIVWFATKNYVDSQIGDINTILENIINGGGS